MKYERQLTTGLFQSSSWWSFSATSSAAESAAAATATLAIASAIVTAKIKQYKKVNKKDN
uniref:Uncharacterized protein n=1 Tax=Pristionchus pacificus TaxID=54126 RepID=A0A2A6BBE1_PRIPA|eukprot:PDM63193.1 hypothetical protein PRIPAC_50408 [Pristionchus pacificus]